MNATERGVHRLCAHYGLKATEQHLYHGGRRWAVQFDAYGAYSAFDADARRIKSAWIDSNYYTLTVYIWDRSEHDDYTVKAQAAAARLESWWLTYHNAIVSGADWQTAQAAAEKLYPTPR